MPLRYPPADEDLKKSGILTNPNVEAA